MTLGAFISSGFAGLAAKKFGRRHCLWAACVLCCISNIIMMVTTNIGVLYLGRLLIGFANGYFMTFSQLYIQETSPAKYRGLFLSIFQFCTSFGTLIGTIINWRTAPMDGKQAYLIPLGLIYVVPVLISIGMFFIPESPRWLILQGKQEAGINALTWLRPTGADVALEAEEIRAAIEKERELGSSVGVLDMFRNPVDRRRTMLSVAAVTLQAASGSMFIIGGFSGNALSNRGVSLIRGTSIQSILLHHGQRGRPVRHVQRAEHGRPRRHHPQLAHCRALRPPPRPPHHRSARLWMPAAHHRHRLRPQARHDRDWQSHRGPLMHLHDELQRYAHTPLPKPCSLLPPPFLRCPDN